MLAPVVGPLASPLLDKLTATLHFHGSLPSSHIGLLLHPSLSSLPLHFQGCCQLCLVRPSPPVPTPPTLWCCDAAVLQQPALSVAPSATMFPVCLLIGCFALGWLLACGACSGREVVDGSYAELEWGLLCLRVSEKTPCLELARTLIFIVSCTSLRRLLSLVDLVVVHVWCVMMWLVRSGPLLLRWDCPDL